VAVPPPVSILSENAAAPVARTWCSGWAGDCTLRTGVRQIQESHFRQRTTERRPPASEPSEVHRFRVQGFTVQGSGFTVHVRGPWFVVGCRCSTSRRNNFASRAKRVACREQNPRRSAPIRVPLRREIRVDPRRRLRPGADRGYGEPGRQRDPRRSASGTRIRRSFAETRDHQEAVCVELYSACLRSC
jgi:hypothetical protein